MRTLLIAITVILLACIAGFMLLRLIAPAVLSSAPSSNSVARTGTDLVKRPPAAPLSVQSATQIAFDSLGSNKTFLGGGGWSLGNLAHAEWFIASASGRLSAIEIAAEPNYVRQGRERTAGHLDIYLSMDTNGIPGAILEDFYLEPIKPSAPPMTDPFVVHSATRPELRAGAKYWVWAQCPGPGSWTWRFNDQNRTQLSARETEPGVWASAGNGRNGAFTVRVTVEGN